jgi:hypothetical protein
MKTPIEMPRTRAGTMYDFNRLEVGGAPIVVPLDKRGSIESCAWRATQRLGWRFTVREFTQNGTLKIGCWRIEPDAAWLELFEERKKALRRKKAKKPRRHQ